MDWLSALFIGFGAAAAGIVAVIWRKKEHQIAVSNQRAQVAEAKEVEQQVAQSSLSVQEAKKNYADALAEFNPGDIHPADSPDTPDSEGNK